MEGAANFELSWRVRAAANQRPSGRCVGFRKEAVLEPLSCHLAQHQARAPARAVRETCVATCADTDSLCEEEEDCKVRPPLGRRMFMPHVGGGVVVGWVLRGARRRWSVCWCVRGFAC